MEKNNLIDCFYYMGINLSLFIIKNTFSYILSKNLNINKKINENNNYNTLNNNNNNNYYFANDNNYNSEINNLRIQYNNLQKEAEQYNNHQSYVKLTKINRKLEKLKNEIEKKTLEKKNKNYNYSKFNNNNFNQFNYTKYEMNNENKNIFNFLFLQKNFIFEIIMWIITIFLFFSLKNKSLKIPYIEKFQGNILIEYYHTEEQFTLVEIPFRTILICETFILTQLNKLIQYIFT